MKVNMRTPTLLSLTLFGLFFGSHALKCTSNGGPKEEDLKTIYMNCMKSQGEKNSSNNRDFYDDNTREKRKQHKSAPQHGMRDDDWTDRDWTMSRDRTQGRDDWSRDDTMSSRNRPGSSRDSSRSTNRDSMSKRDDLIGNVDYETEMQGNGNKYRTSNQQSRRMKRERSSGHRSQYNPNASKSRDNSYNSDDKMSSDKNSTSGDDDIKACSVYCFVNELKMTGENGMPDKHMMIDVVTKGVKNEDLRDFLQDSIEECFQILYNENTQDKCEFAKNLIMCLSEKGRANCDDWKDDIKF